MSHFRSATTLPRRTSHRTPALVAPRLTGKRPRRQLCRKPPHSQADRAAFGWIRTVARQQKTGLRDLDHVARALAATTGGWRIFVMDLRRKAPHLPGQGRWRILFRGSRGLAGHALQIGLRRIL